MKKYKKIIILLMAFISTISIFLILDKPNMENITTNSSIQKVLINIERSLPNLDITHFFIFIFIFYFFNSFYFKEEKIKKSTITLSILFSIILVLGYSFQKYNSWGIIFDGKIQILKSIFKMIGYSFIIYILIKKLHDYLKIIANKQFIRENKYLSFVFDKHPNICIPLIFIIIWLPIIVIFYPGVLTFDSITQIKQLYGEYQAFNINIINPEVALNNHHPVISTLIIGIFIKIGEFINNVDLGIYLYILLQLAFFIYVIVYSFKLIKKMNLSNMIKLPVLIFYILCPMYLIFTLNVLKDVSFSICIFYYILLLIEIIIDKNVLKKKSYLFKIIITLFLITMFRNNGIYTIILSLPFLILYMKGYRGRLTVCLAIPLIAYICINKIVYPILEISPGSIKEMLSIPFQQTARTLNEGKEYEKEDLEIINKILDLEKITREYDPTISDPVKDTFNKEYKSEELVDYFMVWTRYLLKYPDTYIEATINNSYAYLYPNKSNLIGYCSLPKNIQDLEKYFELRNANTFQRYRNIVEGIGRIEKKMPVIGTINSAGFYSWMLIILAVYTIIVKKQRKYICIYFALLSILLVCIASPYFAIRYMLSIVYTVPILIMLSIYISKDENKEEYDSIEK